jgi:YjbE family integral membrane protein
MDYHILLAAGGIALIDIVLSGDNALVIGAAASRLPRRQRSFAIIWGGVGAVVLRLGLSAVATELLQIALLQLIGGVIIFAVAVRLLLPQHENAASHRAHDRLLPAIFTILIADVTMSLDNILAIGALANGHIPLLVIGLAFSMLLLFIASALIARLMERMAWLIDVASIILAWTAANLVLGDPTFTKRISLTENQQTAVHLGFVALIILIDLLIRAVHARPSHRIPVLATGSISSERESSRHHHEQNGHHMPSAVPVAHTTSVPPATSATSTAPTAPSDALPPAGQRS